MKGVRHRAHNRIADGGLRVYHVVVEAAHQFTRLGIGEEAERHALKMGEETATQIINDPFARRCIEAPDQDANTAGQNRDDDQSQTEQIEAFKAAGWICLVRECVVDQVSEDERREHLQRSLYQNQHQRDDDCGAIGTSIT